MVHLLPLLRLQYCRSIRDPSSLWSRIHSVYLPHGVPILPKCITLPLLASYSHRSSSMTPPSLAQQLSGICSCESQKNKETRKKLPTTYPSYPPLPPPHPAVSSISACDLLTYPHGFKDIYIYILLKVEKQRREGKFKEGVWNTVLEGVGC